MIVPAGKMTASSEPALVIDTPSTSQRVHVAVRGAVQGVGFRPFVHRLASEMGLAGWIANTMQGAQIEVEGDADRVAAFVDALRQLPPGPARIEGMTLIACAARGASGFVIRESDTVGAPSARLAPDLAPCPDCLREVSTPSGRRFRYPFTSCARCGPRFTIVESLPYDRARTTMNRFPMCPDCRREYDDPADRRFHAEASACPACGPALAWLEADRRHHSAGDDALGEAVEAIRRGLIVALKGVGGVHLIADATNDRAVAALRVRKGRPDKPLAVLCGSLDAARELCAVTDIESEALGSPAAPIVLLRARRGTVSARVAPNNPWLGVMLPASPLHHLLANDLRRPLVATSGNHTDEPICIRDDEALDRLGLVADGWLLHNRPIARRADDSVVRVIAGAIVVIRSGRGYAPQVFSLGRPSPPMVAVGTHLKNAPAVTVGDRIVLGPHVGTLDSVDARTAAREAVADLTRLFHLAPQRLVCDLHPDDAAALDAKARGGPVIAVQHHRAHVLSCLAEHGLDGPVLGVAWDGTGYGGDGTVWGGEFLVVDRERCRRVGRFRRFRLPGGERAIREPRRAALGVLFELLGPRAAGRTDLAPVASLSGSERSTLIRMLARGLNAPPTSSAGRLFDAVAGLIGLRQVASFEGQAAMELEGVIDQDDAGRDHIMPYAVDIVEREEMMVVDWGPMISAILDDLARGAPTRHIARAFHDALAEAVVAVAQRAGQPGVVLTGGCFQNRVLSERCGERLDAAGFLVYRHHLVPPNDGGIALGQILGAANGEGGIHVPRDSGQNS